MPFPPTAATTVPTSRITISYIFYNGMSESRTPDHGQLQMTHKAVYTFYSTGDGEALPNAEIRNTELKITNHVTAICHTLSSLPHLSNTGSKRMVLPLNGSTERWEEGTQ